jgi:cytochrome c oxidase cbb3-type subunit 3
MATKIEKDGISGQETTGHEWDGIKELNTPLPKWWLYSFYACIAIALGYTVFYPSWPSLSGHTPGVLGWTQRDELRSKLEEEKARRAPMLAKIEATPIDQIRHDPELMTYVQAAGRTAFADNCATCHGAGGAGSKSYPTLADDDWIWGGSPEQILQTISYGIRNANPESHAGDMPRFGADGVLTREQIADVAQYVLSLSKPDAEPGADKAAEERGAAIFAENCAACHGDAGEGNQDMGAPRLNDGIWLYGGDRDAVVESITNGRKGSMPAWSERLDPATIKILAAYVHALGGGR